MIRPLARAAALPAETIITGLQGLGANELSIVCTLDLVVSHLERNHGVKLGKAGK